MKLFLASERAGDADVMIAAHEQSKLEDLLVFIDAYVGGHASVREACRRLGRLPNKWFSQVDYLSKPYVQFQLGAIERVLSAAMRPQSDRPVFSELLLKRLAEALRRLEDHIVCAEPVGDALLEWGPFGSGSHGVLLDGVSAMARYLIVDNFGEDKLPILSGAEAEAWRSAFANAQTMLGDFLPEAVAYLQGNMAVIVPVLPGGRRLSLSCTPASVNRVFLASRVSAKYLAEAMVHEVSHDCLNRINMFEPHYHTGGRGYYSPFRSDTRPASGLLHAAYSFVNVNHYLYRVHSLEPRLADWAADRLDGFLFNTILCTRILAACQELPPAGARLLSTMAIELDRFRESYGLSLSEEMREEKRAHFEAWAAGAGPAAVDLSRDVFEDLIASASVRRVRRYAPGPGWFPKSVPLQWLRENFQRSDEPVIVRGETLAVSTTLLQEMEKLRETNVRVLETKNHRGYSDTPSKFIQLNNYIEDIANADNGGEFFLVMKNIEREITNCVWKADSFFDAFWLEGKCTWLFWNAAGLLVPLHNDSVNNLHCIISGKKTFYLSPPQEEFDIGPWGGDYNAGFSAFRPFDNIKTAEQVGAFISLDEGDMLYLPRGWWHSVRYDSRCLAISAFDESPPIVDARALGGPSRR